MRNIRHARSRITRIRSSQPLCCPVVTKPEVLHNIQQRHRSIVTCRKFGEGWMTRTRRIYDYATTTTQIVTFGGGRTSERASGRWECPSVDDSEWTRAIITSLREGRDATLSDDRLTSELTARTRPRSYD